MLNLLIFSPLFATFFALIFSLKFARTFAILASSLILALNFKLFLDFNAGVDFSFRYSFEHLKFLSYSLKIDNIALILMLLSSLMIFLSFVFFELKKGILAAIFLLEFAIFGLFAANDAMLFYIFWEFSLLPLLFITGAYSNEHKSGMKFFIYAFFGSILMLVAMIYQSFLIYEISGIFSFDLDIWRSAPAPELKEQIWLFLAFFLAFAIKSPLFPFHTWAPRVYSKAPILVSVMLVSFKMAPFGFLRFNLELFPDASAFFSPLIATLCIISIIYCALIAFRAKEFKELIAYSSFSHLGVIIIGIFSFNEIGLSGAVYYMFAHGVVSGALFWLAELLKQKYKNGQISYFHSLASKASGFTIFFALILFASVSLPLTISFVGEFLVLLGVAKLNLIYALLAGFVVILGAIYMLALMRKICFMKGENELLSFSLNPRQISALIPVVFIIFYLGISPNIFLNPLEKEAKDLIENLEKRAKNPANLEKLTKGEQSAK